MNNSIQLETFIDIINFKFNKTLGSLVRDYNFIDSSIITPKEGNCKFFIK